MKKIWKALIIFEIILLALFLGAYFFHEQKWLKEKYVEDLNNYNFGIYNPVITTVNEDYGCVYNVGIKTNPEIVCKNYQNVNKFPN